MAKRKRKKEIKFICKSCGKEIRFVIKPEEICKECWDKRNHLSNKEILEFYYSCITEIPELKRRQIRKLNKKKRSEEIIQKTLKLLENRRRVYLEAIKELLKRNPELKEHYKKLKREQWKKN